VAKGTLQSRAILVTRPAGQADAFCRYINEAGGEAIAYPVIEVRPIPIPEHEAEQLRNWNHFDLALFVSANAVHYALAHIDTRIPSPSIGAVGAKTANLLKEAGFRVDLVPEDGFNSESLLALPELQSLTARRVLILKGAGGRGLLRETLEERGAQVVEIDLYQRGLPMASPGAVNQKGRQGDIHLVTVTSVEGLANLQELLGPDGQRWLKQTPLLAGSARIAEQALTAGFSKIVVASDPSDESMFDAVLQWNKENKA
jgi:uroporphyrinogen-III synthase